MWLNLFVCLLVSVCLSIFMALRGCGVELDMSEVEE